VSTLLEMLEEADRPKTEEVTIGGKKFIIGEMSPTASTIWLALALQAGAEKANVPANVTVAQGIRNPDGSIPEEAERKAAAVALNKLSGAEVRAAAKRVLELSGLTRGSLETATKN
jgi:hypothetical protein